MKAFLYYYTSPEKTPASLGNYAFELHQVMILRLSKVESDLCEQTVCRGRVHFILFQNPITSLYEKLRLDQLIPDDLDGALATIPKNLIQYSRNNVLYTLNDTFTSMSLTLRRISSPLPDQGVESLRLIRLFFRCSSNVYECRPYTGADTNHHLLILLYIDHSHESIGSVLARFDRSTLRKHKGTRTVVLR